MNSEIYYIRSFFFSQQEIIEHTGTWEGIECFVKKESPVVYAPSGKASYVRMKPMNRRVLNGRIDLFYPFMRFTPGRITCKKELAIMEP